MKYLLGVDVGTSGTRAALLTTDGDLIFTTYTHYDFKSPASNWVEQDGDLYWENVITVIKRAVTKTKENSSEIIGACISGLAPDALLVDREGKPLYPALLWLDRRAIEEEVWLKKEFGEENIFDLTGNVIDSYFGMVKILWLKKNRKEIYDKAYKVLNIADYIVQKLTGKFVTDYSHAACTGIAYNAHKKEWDVDMLKELGIDEDKLPKLERADSIAGYVTKEAALITGLDINTPVAVGTSDGMANFVAAGISQKGENVTSLGTSGLWGILTPENKFVHKMLNIPAFMAPHANITIAALAYSGGLYKWLRDNIFGEDKNNAYQIMDQQAELISAGSGGLITLPYLAGERTPIWDPYARGVLFGLSINSSKSSIFRSALEGVGLAFLDNLKRIEADGVVLNSKMIVTGGGAQSKVLRQILADVLGLNIIFVGGQISAEVGDCFIAGKAVGAFSGYEVVKEKIPILEKTEPNLKLNKFYNRLYEEIYKEIYPRLKDLFRKMEDLRGLL
jgi:sugar (pentulose or hexulose) kinase